jgi:hypothetical protein
MIKNYTSSVPAGRSVAHIEEQLISHGATEILKLCENGRIIGIAFCIMISDTKTAFRLPAKIENIEKYFTKKLSRRPTANALAEIKRQSERTAWKLLSDEVDIQMSRIELDQVELAEVYMGYLYDAQKRETLFSKWQGGQFQALEYKQ